MEAMWQKRGWPHEKEERDGDLWLRRGLQRERRGVRVILLKEEIRQGRQGGVRPKGATKQNRAGQVKVGRIQCVISV